MSRGRPEKRVPVCYGVDFGKRVTTRDVAEAMADRCDRGDGPGASDVLDEMFIFGAWGNVLARDDGDRLKEAASGLLKCRRNIRALVRAAYAVGCERERLRCLEACRAVEEELATNTPRATRQSWIVAPVKAAGANACVERLRARGEKP